MEGEVNAGSASAPYTAHPAPASRTARGTPTPASHVDDSTACQAPPADKANGSLRPAHTEEAQWLAAFQDPSVDQLQKGLGLHPQTLLRVGGVVFRPDLALRPRLGQSLGLIPRKLPASAFRTGGKSLPLFF